MKALLIEALEGAPLTATQRQLRAFLRALGRTMPDFEIHKTHLA